ncbi:DUF3048 domain-containing protein [Patescibacteria group bacterium]|nr:DUF3048 domain-containing protein [Patescibacteria group bacterium]MBU1672898.1 DUF3048 domain-containing protein [Patescibacteria group bacterium]MBU1963149.1 DUF3048 domain-containing protein [Patescibacteria group bacterium]
MGAWDRIRYDRNVQLGIVISALVVISLLIWGGIGYTMWKDNQGPRVQKNFLPEVQNGEVKTKGGTEPRKLDGIIVSVEDANKYPVGVMIENLAGDGVRPQFGLSRALVVYEVIVEGGITRFMALFGGEESTQIGPVRSARPTFLEFASEYDVVYTHAGGSPEALGAIDGLKIKDINALTGGSKYFWRDTGRFAPHNLFTSSELLEYALRDKGLENKEVDFESWDFRDGRPIKDRAEGDKFIKLFFSSPGYDVEWKYNRENNNYERLNGGVLQNDAVNGETITAKNIVVQIVPPEIPAGEKGRINFIVTGQGKAMIFHEGQAIEGIWKKKDRLARTKYYDEEGKEIQLIRGNTWVEILPEDKILEYN